MGVKESFGFWGGVIHDYGPESLSCFPPPRNRYDLDTGVSSRLRGGEKKKN